MQMYDFQPSLHFSCDLLIIAQPASSNKCFVVCFTINYNDSHCPATATRIRFVVPDIPSGTPAVITASSPSFR